MPSKPDTIRAIAVKGFKSIHDEQKIEIKPLTLLAGANSSGKSSLMQPLLLLKQTLEAPGDPGALLLDGPNVRFTHTEQLLSKVKKSLSEFAVRLELSDGESLEAVFSRKEKTGIDVAAMIYSKGATRVKVNREMTHDEIAKHLPPPYKELYDYMNRDKESYRWVVRRERCFFSFAAQNQKRLNDLPTSLGLGFGLNFVPHLQGVIHLPGLRGNPRRTYPKNTGGPRFFGTFEDYVASIITQWQSGDTDKLNQLTVALEKMGLTWKVKAEPVDDTQVELRVGRLIHGRQGGARDLVNITDVGFGVSQSLPVVVASIVANPGQIVYIEQPEIHLHPRAQRQLAHVLKNSAKRGVRLIVETHSSLLLKEVQTLIATGEISKDDVALHWLQRKEDGSTQVSTAELDDNGAYGSWPEDFDEVELESVRSYMDAVESKQR